jgi:Outer membrane receptor proteins, mostly Fe transport
MLTFEPHDSTQIYVKYAQAVRSASLFQASRGFSTQIVDYQTYKLKPERQKNWELGTNLIFDDVGGSDNVLGLKFAYFRNFTKDYLTRTNTRGRLQTVNIKSALYRGYETSAYFDMRSFYTQIGVTHYIRTRFCRKPEQLGLVNDKTQCYNGGVSGSNIANTLPPKTTITTTLGFRFWGEKLELGARHSYYSKRVVSIFSTNNSIGETNSAEWKPYALVDLFANYKISKDLIVSATLDNLTNRYYLDANNMGLNPAPGRTLRLNLDYKF